MGKLARLSISVNEDLLEKFDRRIVEGMYPTRSKAVADLMRESLVAREWKSGKEIEAHNFAYFDSERYILYISNHNNQNLSNIIFYNWISKCNYLN